jgi:hypothetical protein
MTANIRPQRAAPQSAGSVGPAFPPPPLNTFVEQRLHAANRAGYLDGERIGYVGGWRYGVLCGLLLGLPLGMVSAWAAIEIGRVVIWP